MIDVTSLYPWVNKYCEYPVGHPEIITDGFRDIDTYFGLVKCKVSPPKKLYHPVLPYRCHGKLMFPLCRTSAEMHYLSICSQTDDERSITGTFVTEEIYEVYNFESSSTDLFRSYIDLFLKIKQEASGYPKECLTEEQKSENKRSYSEKENINLDKNSINLNLGLRNVMNLALNSFWGSDGKNDPPLGNFLGEFTDELNGGIITSFVKERKKTVAFGSGGKRIEDNKKKSLS
ncbi:uncharacterized protein NPIL_244541 [Nephila pilipes]|uniref:DNA-directed DNA polymerase n=1 Tax=Nephila pilipes TaxID=299642 RepID=A0A8X6JKC9_NEPPI|nr:uncharacterized protein NPIL_244541 [Nephila pilipes]